MSTKDVFFKKVQEKGFEVSRPAGYQGKRKTRYPVALAAPSGAGLSPAR